MNEKWVADEIMALKKGDSKTHASTHGNSGSDRVTLDSSQITSGTLNTARMPIATTTAVGSVKVGSGLSVTSDGTLSANGSSTAWGNITGTLSNQTDLNTALSGKASSSHSHAATDITSGQLAIARIPTGTSSSTVCVGNDYRLSNARSPTSHSHSYSDLPTASTSSRGCVQVGSGLSISNGVLSASGGGISSITISATTSSTNHLSDYIACNGNDFTNNGGILLAPQKSPATISGVLYHYWSSSASNLKTTFRYCPSWGSTYVDYTITTSKNKTLTESFSFSCVWCMVTYGNYAYADSVSVT